MKNLRAILFWSIISAAFIGPGTVTTAAKAGASFDLRLLWALTFSIIGTVVLQEAAARLSIVSGKNIGQIISTGDHRKWGQLILVFLTVAFGCAAYQAGNMLGAVAGLNLFSDWNHFLTTFLVFIIGFALLWTSNFKLIATVLGFVVAIMGFAFVYVAFKTDTSASAFLFSAVRPSLPDGGNLLLIGLIGTTIVPYNLFLGNGIKHGQEMKQMRFGLIIAIILGGIISMSIMVVGTEVTGEFSFQSLSDAISNRGGHFLGLLFGIGLAAAGLSSSITSPLAAAITAQSTFNDEKDLWNEKGYRFKSVWMIIMAIGLVIGLSGVKVIPVIIAAQALNGLLLPVVACYLILIVNRADLMGRFKNGLLLNILSLMIIGVCIFLGLNNIFNALSKIFSAPEWNNYIGLKMTLSIVGIVFMGWKIFIKRKE
ncbi:Nramp family divalent metal transporter [Portibacter marinus]|uniref:Nramp family divalent metal transporter n=1 Tax=Portibacter marinus TaxID=2898660 RepID=UPI001F38B342|nr:Nramp family divalent metal transporter [Portibacter marinus]